mgnify:CR=1 FL=1
MDGRKGGKGRGFERFFDKGGKGSRPQGDRPRGDRPQGDRPYGGKSQGDRPYGGKPQGDRPYGRPQGDRPYGDRPQGDRPYGGKPQGDRPYGSKPQGDRPYGRPQGDRPYGDRPQGDRPYGGKPQGDRPYGSKPQGDRSYGSKPQGDRSYGGKPQRPFREDGRYDKGPGPRYSKAPERPVPPAVFEDGEREKPEAPRYGKPVQPQSDRAPRYGRPAQEGGERPAPRYGRPVQGDGERPAPRYGRPVPKFDRPTPKFDKPGARYDRPAPIEPEEPGLQEEEVDNLLVGRNPIREALKSGQPIEKMLVAQGELTGSARELVAKAREAGIVVQFVERARLDAVYPNHQGMLAYASAAAYSSVDDILALAARRDEEPFIVVLDGVTDPHNLGAIIRTAECCGAHGVIVPERRAAGLNPAAVKASAGALSYLPVARVGNLSRTLAELKEKGLWVIGCDMSGGDIRQSDLSGPVALVIGSEGEGVSRLVLEGCDRVISIPLKGQIASLNASVAAGIALYEVMRTRSGQ